MKHYTTYIKENDYKGPAAAALTQGYLLALCNLREWLKSEGREADYFSFVNTVQKKGR